MGVMFNPERAWDARYAGGGTSGAGSQGIAAVRKAAYVNDLVRCHRLESIVDWGCGDGVVLAQFTTDVDYTGVDVSPVIIDRLTRRFSKRRFLHIADAVNVTADLALSFDVIFHFPDDEDYQRHMRQVFGSAKRLVAVHATDHDGGRTAQHVRWRRWTCDIPADWELVDRPADPEALGFYLCRRTGGQPTVV